MGTLTLRGPSESMCINAATTGPVFLIYLDKVLLPQLWPGAAVIVDNLAAHKFKAFLEKIEASGVHLPHLSLYTVLQNGCEGAAAGFL